MDAMFELMQGMGLIPVIKVDDADDAVPLCAALSAGCLPVAEITFRTKAGPEALRRVVQELPEVLAGAGTVTSLELARQAQDAGAKYVVTPGFNPEVVRWCLEHKLPVLPGCTTASEVEAAQNLGLSVVKFFPAEQSGGLARIKALSGPYPAMRYIPTGGIGLHNLVEYLDCPLIVACGGSFMVTDTAIRAKDWTGISAITRKAMDTVLGLSLSRVSLPASAPLSQTMSALFPVTCGLEIVEAAQPNEGIVTLTVHSVERACFQLSRRSPQGVRFNESVARRDKKGLLESVELLEPVHGVRILLQRKTA